MVFLFFLLSFISASFSLSAFFLDLMEVTLAAHLLGALSGWMAARRLRPRTRGFPLFDLVMAIALPCIGGACVALTALGQRTGKRGTAAEDIIQTVDTSVSSLEAGLTKRPEPPPNPEALAPMGDVLRSDAGIEEKRAAIEALMRLETPASVEILREALGHELDEVRFYAASALSRLEERMGRRIEGLRRDLEAGLGEPGVIELELARSYFDYAYYRIVEDIRRDAQLKEARRYAILASERSIDPEAWIVAGRACLELYLYREAASHFDQYLRMAGENVKGLLWRAEAAYRLGDYPTVSRLCRRVRELGGAPAAVQGVLDMWAPQPSEPSPDLLPSPEASLKPVAAG